jgi:hypothetical protein
MIYAFLVLSQNSHTIIIELFLSCLVSFAYGIAHLDFVPASAIDVCCYCEK